MSGNVVSASFAISVSAVSRRRIVGALGAREQFSPTRRSPRCSRFAGTFGKLIESYRLRRQLRPFLLRIAAVSSVGVAFVSILLITAHQDSSSWIFGAEIGIGSMSVVVFALVSVVLFNTTTELLNGLRKSRVVSAMHTVNSLTFTAFSVAGLFLWRDWRSVLLPSRSHRFVD